MRTEAFTTVKMLADIGPNWLGRVHCKVDTSAGGNVMALHVFQKLFPSWLDTNDKSTGLHPPVTWLTAYNGSAIPQLGAHDTAIEWRPSSTGPPRHVHTQWYIDTSGPAILGLPSSLKLGVMQLNCAIQFAHKWEDTPNLPRRPTTEHEKVTGDLLPLWNWQHSTDNHPFPHSALARTSFLPTSVALKELDTSLECTQFTFMTMQNLSSMHPQVSYCYVSTCVWEAGWIPWAGDIVPVTEPTDWVSSLAYSWKANGKLQVCLDPKDLNHPFPHSALARTSLLPTSVALKELDTSLECTQFIFMTMQNLSSMHPTSALLLCVHLCMRSWMNSLSRRYSTSNRTYWLGVLTCLFLEGQWKTTGLFRPQGSQCCYPPWPLPYSNPGWDHSQAWW